MREYSRLKVLLINLGTAPARDFCGRTSEKKIVFFTFLVSASVYKIMQKILNPLKMFPIDRA